MGQNQRRPRPPLSIVKFCFTLSSRSIAGASFPELARRGNVIAFTESMN